MDRPCGLLHPGPAAGPLQSTFPQSEPGPRELRAQAPPPSPATGWRRTRPRPESRARRAARNCLLLCCCCATTWLFFSFFLNSFCRSSSPKPRLKQTRIFAPHPEDRRWPFQLLLPIRESADVSLSKKLTVFGIVATGVGPIKGFFESSWKCPGLALGTAEFRGGLLFP